MLLERRLGSIALAAVASLPLTGCGLLGYPKVEPVDAADVASAAAPECKPDGEAVAIAACEAGDGAQCNIAGVRLENGICAAPDAGRAAVYFLRACEVGFGQGCNNLGWLYALGRGVKQHPRRAMALFMNAFDTYQRDCAKGEPDGCVQAGTMLLEGRGPELDDAVALRLFDRACELGDRRGCAEATALR